MSQPIRPTNATELAKSKLNFIKIYSTMIIERIKDPSIRDTLSQEQYQNLVSLAQALNTQTREASASLDIQLAEQNQTRATSEQEDREYVDHALAYIYDGKGPTRPIISAQRG